MGTTAKLREEYSRRLQGVVSPKFRDATVAFVGVGGSSYAAEKLARLCPAHIKLLDMDYVALSNLSRTSYRFADAANERLKVYALQERIGEINPLVNSAAYPWDITKAQPASI